MLFRYLIFVSILHATYSHAGFDCYCNLNHPEALIFGCPNRQGFPIAALRTPLQVYRWQSVNLQTPYCVPKLVNIQPKDSWIPVYINGQVGYLNADADFALKKCTGMLTFNPNSLVLSPSCNHNITSTPGLSVTGNQQNQVQTTALSTTAKPPTTRWIKIPQNQNKPTTTLSWILIPQKLTTTAAPWILIPNTPRPTAIWLPVSQSVSNTARCYGPDVENDVQKKQSIFYHKSRFCKQNGAAADEVTAAKYCSAPEPTLWRPGQQVVKHCQVLPKYSPVSTFNGGSSNGDGTAIFIECTKKGTIKVVRQTCKSKTLELVEFLPTIDLFVIDW